MVLNHDLGLIMRHINQGRFVNQLSDSCMKGYG